MGFFKSLLGGNPKSETQSSQTTTKNIPDWLLPQMKDVAKRTSTLTSQPYEAYTGERLAQLTPEQLQAYKQSAEMQGIAGAEIQGAQDIMGQVVNIGLNGYSQDQLNQYMNPFTQNVMDIQKRRALEQFNQDRASMMERAGVTGAFGGSRNAIERGNMYKDFTQQLADSETMQLSSAFDKALANAQQGTATAANAANSLTNMALGKQGASTTDISTLNTAGLAQQNQTQAGLDIAYQDWQKEQSYPYEQLQFASSIYNPMAGIATGSTTEGWSTTEQDDGKGWLQKGIGTAISIGSMFADGGLVAAPTPSQSYVPVPVVFQGSSQGDGSGVNLFGGQSRAPSSDKKEDPLSSVLGTDAKGLAALKELFMGKDTQVNWDDGEIELFHEKGGLAKAADFLSNMFGFAEGGMVKCHADGGLVDAEDELSLLDKLRMLGKAYPNIRDVTNAINTATPAPPEKGSVQQVYEARKAASQGLPAKGVPFTTEEQAASMTSGGLGDFVMPNTSASEMQGVLDNATGAPKKAVQGTLPQSAGMSTTDALLAPTEPFIEATKAQVAQAADDGVNLPLLAFGAAMLGAEGDFFKALGAGGEAYVKTTADIKKAEEDAKQQAIKNEHDRIQQELYAQQIQTNRESMALKQEMNRVRIEALKRKAQSDPELLSMFKTLMSAKNRFGESPDPDEMWLKAGEKLAEQRRISNM